MSSGGPRIYRNTIRQMLAGGRPELLPSIIRNSQVARQGRENTRFVDAIGDWHQATSRREPKSYVFGGLGENELRRMVGDVAVAIGLKPIDLPDRIIFADHLNLTGSEGGPSIAYQTSGRDPSGNLVRVVVLNNSFEAWKEHEGTAHPPTDLAYADILEHLTPDLGEVGQLPDELIIDAQTPREWLLATLGEELEHARRTRAGMRERARYLSRYGEWLANQSWYDAATYDLYSRNYVEVLGGLNGVLAVWALGPKYDLPPERVALYGEVFQEAARTLRAPWVRAPEELAGELFVSTGWKPPKPP